MHNYYAEMPPSTRVQPSRAEALRALAHPLRSRLLAQLRVHGAATSTELAHALETNSGATSYHLRVLEAAGQVRDNGMGKGRRRVWEASAIHARKESITSLDPDEVAIERWLQHDLVQYVAERTDAWIHQQDKWPEAWKRACGLDDYDLLITTEQLSALAAEIAEVFDRYRRIGAGSPGARRAAAYVCLLPIDSPAVAGGSG